LVALLPKSKELLSKYVALVVSVFQLFLGVILYLGFTATSTTKYDLSSFQYTEFASWINLSLGSIGKLSASYLLGVDGLNIALVLLTVVVTVIAVISSWNLKTKVRGYFSLFLLLNAAIIGCFVSLDLLLFYLFFEFMLLPMYFLIGLWGGPRREYASIKFFLYTLLGSILILIVMVGLYMSVIDPQATAVELKMAANVEQVTEEMTADVQRLLAADQIPENAQVHTFNMLHMGNQANYIPGSLLDYKITRELFGHNARTLAFLIIFIGFAIKIPVVPLHTWLPDAHVEAPTSISVILAALLLKVGGYALIRTGYLILPDGAVHYSWLVGFLGVLSIIYGALNALASKDLKRLIAYSSVSHMGFVLLGLASMTSEGVSGAIYQMVSHGIISAGLFLIAGVIYDRTNDRIIHNYSGLATMMPKYTVITVVFFFASLGLPGFSGFIAEIFVLLGAFSSSVVNGLIPRWMMIVALIGLILSAAYYLWTIQRMFLGKLHLKTEKKELTDLNAREILMFLPLVLGALALGIFPDLLLEMINGSVNTIIEFVAPK
ncbi:NADH-quinone oxidoreductase subunit M, partial [Fulvivirga sp. RKSG066]|uniref:complex I subunit 4 family protein n=1 Tax=Fulvivirga aurantia TaxID=2529383 RepID=UPI0012BCABCE